MQHSHGHNQCIVHHFLLLYGYFICKPGGSRYSLFPRGDVPRIPPRYSLFPRVDVPRADVPRADVPRYSLFPRVDVPRVASLVQTPRVQTSLVQTSLVQTSLVLTTRLQCWGLPRKHYARSGASPYLWPGIPVFEVVRAMHYVRQRLGLI